MGISLDGEFLTLTEAAKRLPGRPHVSTLHRWRTRGVGGIRLRTRKIGGRRVVSITDLENFIDEVTAADKTPALTLQSSTACTKQIEQAEAELRQLGILGKQPRSKSTGEEDRAS